MDDDKVVETLNNSYNTVEKKAIEIVKGQANFIFRLRKYATNEDPSTINNAIIFGIKMNIAVILGETLAIIFLDWYSVYGIMSKVFSLFILLWLRTIFREV